MTDILIALFSQVAGELRKRPRLRAVLAFVTPLLGIGFLLGRMIFMRGYDGPSDRLADTVFTPLIILAFGTFFVVIITYTPFEFHSSSRSTDAEIDALRRERAELRARLDTEASSKHQGPADVLDTIRLSLNQLTEYYTINKGQAKSSFRASMGAMVVGLLTILVGIWIFYTSPGGDVKVAVIAGIAGILAEFIAGAYFYLYNRSLTQLNYFYDKLTAMQDTMLAIRLCDTLPEPRATATKERLIEVLITPGRIATPRAPTAEQISRASPSRGNRDQPTEDSQTRQAETTAPT